MNFTETGKKITKDWMPLAMINGIEWSINRKGRKDQFDCLYRTGLVNKTLWYIGAIIGDFKTWRKKNQQE
uniref:Uncharacterized protein n=1 Tax=viral metagenome TaxID=1070528 RepID=A0A6M3JEA8_9ZZZZ